MARRTVAVNPMDEEAAKMVKYHDGGGKRLGYFESLNARTDLKPAQGFRIAKADEEILPTPVAELYLIVKGGEAVVTVNGSHVLKPVKEYVDGIREYSCRNIVQTPAGQKGGIYSLKISEGAAFKYSTFSISTGGRLW